MFEDFVKNNAMEDEVKPSKKRIKANCSALRSLIEQEESMNKKKFKMKKITFVMVSVLTVMFCGITVTALAATGSLHGFFNDIFRSDGAVVGTSYEQATDEVNITAELKSDNLIISLEFVNPKVVPYSELDTLAISRYEIVDAAGKVIYNGNKTDFTDVANGKSNISISAVNIDRGDYKIIISELIGSKKADQPLSINGMWELNFTKQ